MENDQTLHGGRIEPMQRFFTEVEQHGLPMKMTFDIGNWHWQDQSAPSAARLLGRHVDYVHCKAVARRADGKLVAMPPAATDLHLWEQLLRHMAQGIMRAVEFPLQGDDLMDVTAQHVAALALLGQPRWRAPMSEIDILSFGETMAMFVAEQAGDLARSARSTNALPGPTAMSPLACRGWASTWRG